MQTKKKNAAKNIMRIKKYKGDIHRQGEVGGMRKRDIKTNRHKSGAYN